MTIGGHDIVMEHPLPGHSMLYVFAKAISLVWKESDVVHRDASTSDVVEEHFFFRSKSAEKPWDQLGWNKKHRHDFVHYLESENEITVVVDDPEHPDTAKLIENFQHLLRQCSKFRKQVDDAWDAHERYKAKKDNSSDETV